MFAAARSFFARRNVLEVDCPLLSPCASVDVHIDLIPCLYGGKETYYLFSSPEYGMKRLLSEGMGEIYQMGHVFRDGELGDRHQPEFTLVEWYRLGISLEVMMEETAAFCCLFLGEQKREILTYKEAFLCYAKIDPFEASIEELQFAAEERKVDDRDELLNLILGTSVEPHLGKEGLTILMDYPSSQAALAQTRYREGHQVAERFEIYFKGVELANGYHELADAQEQRRRLEEANRERKQLEKSELPIDERFLEALERGLPDCCGVAVGFDRLMMLRHGIDSINEVLPLPWE